MGKRGGGYRHRGPDQLRRHDPDRVRVLPMFDDVGGLRPGAAREIYARTGVPEAEVWGTGSFYHLVARPEVEARVCTGLTCELAGATEVLDGLRASGVRAEGCACLAQCDRAPAVLLTRTDHGYDVASFAKPGVELDIERPTIALTPSSPDLAIDLAGDDDLDWTATQTARALEPAQVCTAVADSGLRGRGGAGFPAGIKWRAVLEQTEAERYIICNADEGEPGTFKDREVMVRRPHLVLEAWPSRRMRPVRSTSSSTCAASSTGRAAGSNRRYPRRAREATRTDFGSRWRSATAPTSAVRRRRCSRRWKGGAGCRGTSRPSRPRRGCTASRR